MQRFPPPSIAAIARLRRRRLRANPHRHPSVDIHACTTTPPSSFRFPNVVQPSSTSRLLSAVSSALDSRLLGLDHTYHHLKDTFRLLPSHPKRGVLRPDCTAPKHFNILDGRLLRRLLTHRLNPYITTIEIPYPARLGPRKKDHYNRLDQASYE
jgi:hypothetical protein